MQYMLRILFVSVPITSPLVSPPPFASPAQRYSFFSFRLVQWLLNARNHRKPPWIGAMQIHPVILFGSMVFVFVTYFTKAQGAVLAGWTLLNEADSPILMSRFYFQGPAEKHRPLRRALISPRRHLRRQQRNGREFYQSLVMVRGKMMYENWLRTCKPEVLTKSIFFQGNQNLVEKRCLSRPLTSSNRASSAVQDAVKNYRLASG